MLYNCIPIKALFFLKNFWACCSSPKPKLVVISGTAPPIHGEGLKPWHLLKLAKSPFPQSSRHHTPINGILLCRSHGTSIKIPHWLVTGSKMVVVVWLEVGGPPWHHTILYGELHFHKCCLILGGTVPKLPSRAVTSRYMIWLKQILDKQGSN